MEVKERARTRKAFERERKKEKKRTIKAEAKRSLKAFLKIAILLISIIVVFIITEVIRFKSNLGVPPGIIRGEEYLTDTVIYTGLLNSYTITYKYAKPFEEYTHINELTDDQIVSGEFKLFNKWLLSAWIK